MSPRSKASRVGSLVEDLAVALGGRPALGASLAGELVVDDLIATVTVTFRRRVPPADARAYQEGALAFLRAHPDLSKRCGCGVNPKRRGGTSRNCTFRVAAAVVVSGVVSKEKLSYRFVCGRHRDAHGIDPRFVVAIVPVQESDLVPIRLQADAEATAWAKQREEKRRATYAVALGPFCDAIGVPEGWTFVPESPAVPPRWTRREGELALEVALTDEGDVLWEVTHKGRLCQFDVLEGLRRATAFKRCLEFVAKLDPGASQ